MLAKNAESSLAGPGCRLIRQPRQPINLETEFAKASQGPADEFIVREAGMSILGDAKSYYVKNSSVNSVIIYIYMNILKMNDWIFLH